ncbi:restriction endonuclease subunit R [Spirosoma taeanense]|uniref:Restriction endonuclease subunit R n=1 Tax=Spirosoma taeanense TaxID=2735870 RepID=A0A6M5Y3P0_9BACT|nr:type I restriction endonuclease [Spirosoma taeanense]QJW89177.1 restriction endonuclease subunit R [Spirosoma taeanense]
MQADLHNFISSKKTGSLTKQGEEATKQGLILPILHHLGWNPFDVQEVFPEYSVQNKRVDYSLRINNFDKVFIEVKKVGEDLEKHQEQLLSYAFRQGVKLAILTNGIIWWFYLPLHEGSWEQRRFYTIDLQSQATDDIADKLAAFLSKADVSSGRAIVNAENIYNSRQKGEIIQQNLPKTWRKLLSESDESLAELMAETVEKICGYKPEAHVIIEFLKVISGETSLHSIPKPPRPKPVERSANSQNHVDEFLTNETNRFDNTLVTNSKPLSFEFNGQTYGVSSWISLLKLFVQVIAETHPNRLNELTALTGKQRPYFTTNSELLRKPNNIPNSSIFFETHFSAQGIVKLISQVLKTMGYPQEAIKINTAAESTKTT